MGKYVFATLLSTFSPRHDGHSVVIRTIELPAADYKNTDEVFEAAYVNGQNDFQPREMCSVSVGDIITIMDIEAGTNFTRKVEGCGFGPDLTNLEVLRMKLVTRREAWAREEAA
tara:strand:- start:639 stop:980 length:342 start_codon:yes stop_codon:yes gene_type:complete